MRILAWTKSPGRDSDDADLDAWLYGIARDCLIEPGVAPTPVGDRFRARFMARTDLDSVGAGAVGSATSPSQALDPGELRRADSMGRRATET